MTTTGTRTSPATRTEGPARPEPRPATPIETEIRHESDGFILAYLVAHRKGGTVRITKKAADRWLKSANGTFRVQVARTETDLQVTVTTVPADGRVPGVIYIHDPAPESFSALVQALRDKLVAG